MKPPAVVPTPEDLNRLRNLALVARWAVEGFISGLHRSPYHGQSAEFLEYRHYTAGEDLRNLDWRVYGRSDRAYTKRYQSETNLRAYILLDTSASMAYSPEGRDKLRYAKGVAACLVYLLQRQGDAVGLATFSDKIHQFRAPKASARHRQELFALLEEASPAGTSAVRPVLDEIAERIGGRSLVILLSDFYDDAAAIGAGLRHLRFKRHEIIALQVVDPSEEEFGFDGLLQMVDLETGARLMVESAHIRDEYLARFGAHMTRIHTLLSDSSIDHHVLRTTTPFADALAAYLAARSRCR